MAQLLLAITILIVIAQSVSAAHYNCTFGPDSLGNYVNEIVDSVITRNCGNFCSCVGLVNNTCHFGPDDQGNFMTKVVPSELADSC